MLRMIFHEETSVETPVVVVHLERVTTVLNHCVPADAFQDRLDAVVLVTSGNDLLGEVFHQSVDMRVRSMELLEFRLVIVRGFKRRCHLHHSLLLWW